MSESYRSKSIYLLPNLFTTAALFAGFYAILAAMSGEFEKAVIALITAGVLDGLDGRIARMTKTQSEFGAQYDSMSDLVAFGVAPALVAYEWALQYESKLGWAAAFMFTACAALRLARFNVQHDIVDKKYFVGLPSPAAAGTLATAVWLGFDHQASGADFAILITVLTVFLALCMVSQFSYYSFKTLDKNRVPFVALLFIISLLSLILLHPPLVLCSIGVLYALSGAVTYFTKVKES